MDNYFIKPKSLKTYTLYLFNFESFPVSRYSSTDWITDYHNQYIYVHFNPEYALENLFLAIITSKYSASLLLFKLKTQIIIFNQITFCRNRKLNGGYNSMPGSKYSGTSFNIRIYRNFFKYCSISSINTDIGY